MNMNQSEMNKGKGSHTRVNMFITSFIFIWALGSVVYVV